MLFVCELRWHTVCASVIMMLILMLYAALACWQEKYFPDEEFELDASDKYP